MSIAFLITSPYQVFHYEQIVPHLSDVTIVCEVRKKNFGLDEALIAQHFPNLPVEWVFQDKLPELDGRFEVIVCQTPILPMLFLKESLVVAQQYSLAKERYQYGTWRSHADANLMYGRRSVEMVAGFCRAVAIGNPMLDSYWQQPPPQRRSFRSGISRPKLLYAPTYGSLSSLDTILPRLRNVDADITLKLHHADDRDNVSGLPSRCQVIYADSDPVAQLRDHDGMISDFSGAAFDAAYTGLPVVLTGAANNTGEDYARLSTSERNNNLLADISQVWRSGTDLFEAFAAAEAKQEGPQYSQFIERTFVNPGSAGKAAAEQIQQLLEQGPIAHFAADQVRENIERYVVTNRSLRSNSSGGGDAQRRPVGAAVVVAKPPSRWPTVYRRTRARLAQVGVLRKIVLWRRQRMNAGKNLQHDPVVMEMAEPRPSYRRDQVWRLLEPYLLAAGIAVAKDSQQVGSPIAVRQEDKRALLRALHKAAAQYPHFFVRAGTAQRLGKLHELSQLESWEMHSADWLEVGGLTESGAYQRDTSGYLSIQVVSLHAERKRYLETRTVPDRSDWTNLFDTKDNSAKVMVGKRPEHAASPVDVVYTWVDSHDDHWQEQLRQYGGGEETDIDNASANNAERYIDRDELRHSLRSLWMFAPFVRNIYIVTADQYPQWLSSMDPRIKIVPHREIFPDPSVLPTFNSHAIETCLHRIPGLAENFIYFNDDVFLGREVTESDFFTSAGLAKVRLSPSQYIYEGRPEPDAIPTDWAAYHAVRLIERDFGHHFDRRVKHVPLVLKRSVLAEIEERYAPELDRTRRARFRSRGDLALPSMFAQYYAIFTARAVEWPDQKHNYVYLDTGKHVSTDRFMWIMDWRPMFYCLNTTRFTQVSLEDQATNLRRFYQQMLPHPAPWELSSFGETSIRSEPMQHTMNPVGQLSGTVRCKWAACLAAVNAQIVADCCDRNAGSRDVRCFRIVTCTTLP